MLVLPLAITWIGAVALALMDGRRTRVGVSAVLCVGASFAATLWLAIDVLTNGPRRSVAGGWEAGVGIVLRADALGVTFAVLSTGVVLVALLFEVLARVRSRSFPALTLFLVTGLNGVFLTGDAFNFYVFFEIAMISAYILTSYGEERRQFRAAAIFAIVNLLGSVLFLISIAALYHITGRLDMEGIASRMATVSGQSAILTSALIFVAFGIKLGLFPFHFWLASVYTGTRPTVAAILSGALANIGSYGLLRFGGEMLPRELDQAAPALFVLGTLSIIYGAIQALSRRSIAEVLAYSSIGQIGYILLALGIGGQAGFAAAILFAIVNSMNKTLLFLSENLRGWLVGATFVIGAFSVTGLPPAAGFIAKASLFRASIEDGNVALVALIFAGGVLSFIYMFQIYQRRFWVVHPDQNAAVVASPIQQRLLMLFIGILVILFGVWPEPLLRLSDRAAAVLTGGST